MDWLDASITEEKENSEEFRQSYDREDRVHQAEQGLVGELVAHRKATGLTQAQLAKRVGVSQSRIAQLESGADGFNLRMLLEVADVLGLSLKLDAPVSIRKVSEPKTKGYGKRIKKQ